jgi:hypothetical protein
MVQSAPSLSTESAKHGNYPRKFNKREQQVAASAKDYVDTTAASVAAAKVSDTAYNESTWNAVTTIAPSKNAVRDQVEAMLTSIGTKQAALTMSQATTGTGGDVGKITLAGMTATGKIIVTAAEDPGTSLVISDVVAGTGIVTVFTKNTDTNARAELSGKLVNYIVIALS